MKNSRDFVHFAQILLLAFIRNAQYTLYVGILHWQGGQHMDHVHLEQSFSDEILREMPEVHAMFSALHIEGSHNRLHIQAEAAGLDMDVVLAAMEMKMRRMLSRQMGDSLN
jgi:hypothetical protein